jgi:hypothetical protein
MIHCLIKKLDKKGILRPSKGILLGGLLYGANDERKKSSNKRSSQEVSRGI